MCLDKITKQYEKPIYKNKWKKAWKRFQIKEDGTLRGQYYDNKVLEVGGIYEAERNLIGRYMSGFHAFETFDDAKLYPSHISKTYIYEIRVKEITLKGIDCVSKVLVAGKMKIIRMVEE